MISKYSKKDEIKSKNELCDRLSVSDKAEKADEDRNMRYQEEEEEEIMIE